MTDTDTERVGPDTDLGPPLDVVSLFSGPGGSSLGYKQAGCRVIGAVDCAPDGYTDYVLDTYRANSETPLFERDVTELTAADLLALVDRDVGDLGILDGSPPCSPFSNVNWRIENAFDHKSMTLFDDYARLVDGIEPQYFVAENVPGIAEGKTRKYFETLCRRLRDAGPGYDLDVYKIDAHKLGSPHRRTRLMFVGSRADRPHPDPVEYTGETSVRDALRGVDIPDADRETAKDKYQTFKLSPAYSRLREGESADMITGGQGWSHQRLAWAKPSPQPVGKPELIHPSENRMLALAELKRLIGLPDDFILCGDSFNQRWECAIRCLPPILIRRLAERIREANARRFDTGGPESEDTDAEAARTDADSDVEVTG